MKSCLSPVLVALLIPVSYLRAADDTPPVQEHIYKKAGDAELKMLVHLPEGWKASDKRPAIVFFFGGGWRNGNPKQFETQAAYLARRGMVAARADYRVKSRQNVTPDACVEDAKSAVRWLRQNARTLGIDPQRIAAAGGSAGGHLAIATSVCPGFEAPNEDATVSSKPNLLVLFNPALISPTDFGRFIDKPEVARNLAPNEHLTRDVPPSILFFGTSDRLIEGANEFLKRGKDLGLKAQLYTAADMGHGFFNRSPWKEATTVQMDRFLTAHGYLKGEPTMKSPADAVLKLDPASTR